MSTNLDLSNYRYFNQPIELIPGWDASKDQGLIHAKDSGLMWIDMIECPSSSPSPSPSPSP